MSKPTPITIDSILGGQSQVKNFYAKQSFDTSIGIDPDMPESTTAGKPSGLIRPTAMEKFSGSSVTANCNWIVTNPKDNNIYTYLSNGLVNSINEDLTMNSDVGTPTSGAGNGAAYYDNYLYLATPTNISRYGPLNGSPSITNAYWGTTLGKAVLTNTVYPTVNGVVMPNHVMHRHTDNKLYVADVLSNSTANTNKGALHYIYSTKTTVEGDTNSASSYNALDLGYGYYPTAIESYGTDLVTAGIEGVDTTTQQRRAFLTFWDATSTSFQKLIQVEFPDPLITALKNVNGALYVFSGSATGGCRVSVFLGGYSFQEVFYDANMYPPLAGAVDGLLNRIIWGTKVTYPETATVVMAYGSQYSQMGKGIQCILKTSGGTTVTALKYAIQGGLRSPLVAWGDGASYGIDKLSTTYGTSVWRSQVYRVGKKFNIVGLRIPLAQTTASNMTITAKIIENGSTVETLPVINSTNYPSTSVISMNPSTLCQSSFQIELRWTGSVLCTVSLPIIVTIIPRED